MGRRLGIATLALLALMAMAMTPASTLGQEYQDDDACAEWRADANPGPEWDADAAEPGPEWDADANPGPEWDADAQEPGPEWDAENGACGAYDEDPSDNQPTKGPLENLFSLFGL